MYTFYIMYPHIILIDSDVFDIYKQTNKHTKNSKHKDTFGATAVSFAVLQQPKGHHHPSYIQGSVLVSISLKKKMF